MPRIQRRQIPYSLGFNGSSSRIVSASNTGLSGDIVASLECWVYVRSYQASGSAVSFGTNSGAFDSMGIFTNTTVAGQASVEFGGNKGWRSAAGFLQANRWYHIVATKRAGLYETTTTLYVNGIVVACTANSGGTPNVVNGKFYVGQFANLGGTYLNGDIAMARLWSTELTAAQVADLYFNNRKPSTPLVEYLLTEGSGTSVSNTGSLAAADGAITVGTWGIDSPSRQVIIDRSMTHSVQMLAASDRISFGNPLSLRANNATISVWVKIPVVDATGGAAILSKDNAFFIGYNAGVLSFYDWGGAAFRGVSAAGVNNIRDNKWHLLTLSYQSGVANGTILCVDGVVVARSTMTVASQISDFSIGNYGSGALANSAVVGAEYADAYFYNVALTSAQIEAWYQSGSAPSTGLVSRWRMNEGSGTSVADSVGANTGTISGSRWLTDSPMRSRIVNRTIPYSSQFNGTNQYGRVTAVPFAGATKVTFLTWVKMVASSVSPVLMEVSPNSVGSDSFTFYQNITGTVAGARTLCLFVNGNTVARQSQCGTSSLQDNCWYRVCGVIDLSLATNQPSLYVNGVLDVASRPINQQVLNGPATNDVFIGMRNGASQPFNGNLIIDRVIIGKAFTAAEALDEYVTGRLPAGGTDLLVYPWNEGSGATITDTSGNGKNIALTNSPAWSADTPMR